MKLSIAFFWLIVIGCLCHGSNAEYRGLDVYHHLEGLPVLRPLEWRQGFSSFDRTGLGYDRGWFLYRSGSEYVMADLTGPGILYQHWATGQVGTRTLRMYLDGAVTPQISTTLNSFFSGTTDPFLSPLNVDADASSGGFYSFLPIAFSNGCRITTTDPDQYYNLAFIRYPCDTSIETWTGTEDSSDVRDQWNAAGSPVGVYTDTVPITTEFDLGPGEGKVLADITGSRIIHSIRLRNPGLQLDKEQADPVTDDGRAFTGYSQFIMAIHPSNDGVRLVRRMDYGIGNQKANVYVDGKNIGQWYDPGSYGAAFYDSSVMLPVANTAGKNSITVKVQFVSSSFDWNEFTYWTYSMQGSNTVLSDTLDVGESSAAQASEAAHSYVIANQMWEGMRTFYYLDFSINADLTWTSGVWVKASWDTDYPDAVDSPVGFFFGIPTGAREACSLFFGLNTNLLEYYNYFPMPFADSGILILTNTTQYTYSNLWCEVRHSTLTMPMDDAGYFHATHRKKHLTSGGRDYIFLDTTGRGHLVGVVHAMKSTGSRFHLEGDERFYIDGSKSPAVYGTGTEDYYMGGWYFDRGTFNLPCHGNPSHKVPQGMDMTACFRLHVPDPIVFRTSLTAGIEYGSDNNMDADYESVAFWYGRHEPSMVLLDTLDVGTAASEAAHDYTNTYEQAAYSLRSKYEGNYDTVWLTDSGRVHTGYSSFSIAMLPDLQAVVLRRRSDYSITNQAALVAINGQHVGTWLSAGCNPHTRWHDDEFVIPAHYLTGGGTTATIRLTATNGAAWSEFKYEVFGIPDTEIPEPAFGFLLLLPVVAALRDI